MTIEQTHQKAMELAKRLRHKDKYNETNDLMRESSCSHLMLLDLDKIKEQGIPIYYREGDILLSSGEAYWKKNAEKEDYDSWHNRTKGELKKLYKCKITGGYCVSKYDRFLHTYHGTGNCNSVIARINIQIRCPAFKHRQSLVDKLSVEQDPKHLENEE
jgi:hypothetical protein